jgi:HEPN domain-containing protein
MKWFSFGDRKKIYTKKDYTVKDLLQYSLDFIETAEKLFEISKRDNWEYLLSAAYLSHLGIELLLKACHLHFFGGFEGIHDLNKLFGPLEKQGVRLEKDSRKWLKELNRYGIVRYPDPEKTPEIDSSHWDKTKSLIKNLDSEVPEIRKERVNLKRYRSNVRSDRTL